MNAGTKLHRAGCEAGNARVPAGEGASDIGLVGRKCVSVPLSGGLFDLLDWVANERRIIRHDRDSNTGLAGDHFESYFLSM